ncbi:hypothetical protein MCC02031_20210 [Bifidobacteriaceae bacterium MCC02031]|nr:hypothetical protein MCC02031_20210 [Bifidobacteriaceae bacterium MCC02031]
MVLPAVGETQASRRVNEAARGSREKTEGKSDEKKKGYRCAYWYNGVSNDVHAHRSIRSGCAIER